MYCKLSAMYQKKIARGSEYTEYGVIRNGAEGVFSKPSGNHIVAPFFCFLSYRLQILATCLFFHFAELCKVSARLDNI